MSDPQAILKSMIKRQALIIKNQRATAEAIAQNKNVTPPDEKEKPSPTVERPPNE